MKTVLFALALALAMPIGAQQVTVLYTVLGAELPETARHVYEGAGLTVSHVLETRHELCPNQATISQDGIIVGIGCGGIDHSDGSAWLDRIKRRYGDPTETMREPANQSVATAYRWKNPTAGISTIYIVISTKVWGIEWFSTETSYENMADVVDAIKTANESNIAF